LDLFILGHGLNHHNFLFSFELLLRHHDDWLLLSHQTDVVVEVIELFIITVVLVKLFMISHGLGKL